MGTDFPAAHSMDTTWFAVDRDGCVASFSSGESGAVPVAALRAWRDSASPDVWQLLRDVGIQRRLFHYGHANRFESPYRVAPGDLWLHNEGPRLSGPYVREEGPADVPLHVDQLPPAARAIVSAVRFAGLRFAREQAIQPAELAPCESEQAEYLTLAGERRPFQQPTPQESH